MGAPAKFLFDVDFSEKATKAKPATPAEVAAQISEAANSGYARGFAAAKQEAETSDTRRMAIALEQIGQAVAAIASGLDVIERRVESEATEVALAVARKLCAELLAREPLAEVSALLEESLRHLVAAPHLVIRVNDAIYDPAKSRIETLAHRLGFEGRLVILAEPELGTGDCRIEWADGGITRDRATTEARIGELIDRYIASRRDAGPKNEG